MKQMPQGTFNGIVVDFQGRVPGYYHYVIPRGEKTHMQTTDLPQPAPHPVSGHGFSHPFADGKTEPVYCPAIGENIDH